MTGGGTLTTPRHPPLRGNALHRRRGGGHERGATTPIPSVSQGVSGCRCYLGKGWALRATGGWPGHLMACSGRHAARTAKTCQSCSKIAPSCYLVQGVGRFRTTTSGLVVTTASPLGHDPQHARPGALPDQAQRVRSTHPRARGKPTAPRVGSRRQAASDADSIPVPRTGLRTSSAWLLPTCQSPAYSPLSCWVTVIRRGSAKGPGQRASCR